jgi:hypothetical protein
MIELTTFVRSRSAVANDSTHFVRAVARGTVTGGDVIRKTRFASAYAVMRLVHVNVAGGLYPAAAAVPLTIGLMEVVSRFSSDVFVAEGWNCKDKA